MNSGDLNNMQAWSKELRKNVMLYPNEKVVAFLGRYFKDKSKNSKEHAFDVGFGSGRHLKLLIDYGFNVSGIDYSETSMKTVENLLGKHPSIKSLSTQSIEELDRSKELYNVIIAYGVIFLREYKDIHRDLLILNQLLRPGGKMLANFRTTEDDMYGAGKHISGKTYLLDEKYPAYENMLYTFFDLEDAKGLLKETGFSIIDIEREDYWKGNLQQKNSWWIFTVEKG